MKRLPGQAGRTIGYLLHHTGMLIMTIFFIIAFGLGGVAYRLSLGPIQMPWLTSQFANMVSGQGIVIHIDKAALAWGGFKNGGGVPLYFELGDITVQNATGVELAEIPTARLVFLPDALLGLGAPVMVTSKDALFAGSNVPLSMLAAIRLGFLHFSKADLDVSIGSGELGAAGIAFPISKGHFTAHITQSDVTLEDGTVTLARVEGAAPVVSFNGAAHLAQIWQGQFNIGADTLQAGALPVYWPGALVTDTRKWVTGNIQSGIASNAQFTFGLSAPSDFSDLSVTNASGHFNGNDLSVGWIPGAQPITGVTGVFTLTDMDNILITASAGKLSGEDLAGSHLLITGVAHRDQFAQLTAPVTGSVSDALKILNAKPLNLLQIAPAILLQGQGTLNGTVTANFPFQNDLKLKQVDLHVDTHLTDLSVPTPVTGLALQHGDVMLNATIQGLQAKGTATLDGQPATLAVTARFTVPQPDIHFNLKTTAGRNLLSRFGLRTSSSDSNGIAGAIPLSVQIHQSPNGQGNANLSADLTPASLRLAALGWSKQAGSAGAVVMTVNINNQSSITLKSVTAHAPGLNIVGTVEAANPRQMNFSQLDIGNTSASGSISAPAPDDNMWRIDLSGRSLDISALVNPPPPAGFTPTPPKLAATPMSPSGPLWVSRLHFEQLSLAQHGAPVLQNLVFKGSGQGSDLLNATATAEGDGGESVQYSLARSGVPALETMHISASDGGYLLRALDAFDNLKGGVFNLNATYTDTANINGLLTISHFRLLHAPVLGKILQGLSLYGVRDATSGPGLVFDQLIAPFSLIGDTLTLKNARAYSTSLGLTATGTVEQAENTVNLSTTIVPAYALNAAPGKIPIIGKLFSAETGGGLFAVRATITGKLSNPTISVNPLSALTPGLLRDVFGVGGSATTTPAK